MTCNLSTLLRHLWEEKPFAWWFQKGSARFLHCSLPVCRPCILKQDGGQKNTLLA